MKIEARTPSIETIQIRERYAVLGVDIDAVQIPTAIVTMESWIDSGVRGKYVAAANVHMIIEAVRNADFKMILQNAGMVVPDGMPLIWRGRRQGFELPRRVYGPDLMYEFCRSTQDKDYRHFFYGGAPGVAEKLVESLRSQVRINSAGTISPPFKSLSAAEDAALVDQINAAHPDILWVCLGCPKQERWMYEHRNVLNVPVMVGVGQAFDIYAGTLRQAPAFMRENGLEWLFRLCIEPRRLWRRYLLYNSRFLYYSALERCGARKF
jgi:N-acetylglucosaminyldiphosphoundecaprenol N-acetyl-beta-D-mannosaminyltransferase